MLTVPLIPRFIQFSVLILGSYSRILDFISTPTVFFLSTLVLSLHCAYQMDNQPEITTIDSSSVAVEDSGWDIKDTHQEKISFTDVVPVDIQMRQVSVDVGISKGFTKIFSRKSSDLEATHTKRILNGVSAEFPQGSLVAIMGGSGSGKVRRKSRYDFFCLIEIRRHC